MSLVAVARLPIRGVSAASQEMLHFLAAAVDHDESRGAGSRTPAQRGDVQQSHPRLRGEGRGGEGGAALRYASEELCQDRDFVLAALAQNGAQTFVLRSDGARTAAVDLVELPGCLSVRGGYGVGIQHYNAARRCGFRQSWY